MIQHLALGMVAICIGIAACDSAEAQPQIESSDSDDGGLVCELTLTRVRCDGACGGEARRTFSQASTSGTCGGNAQVGCLVENATGDFYSSPTTSYFAAITDEFRSCTAAEEEALRAPADAGSDSGDGGLICELTLTRVRCAAACTTVYQQKTFSEVAARGANCGGNTAVGCLVENATGDIYSSPTTSYFTAITDEFRQCTAEEEAALLGDAGVHADAGR